MKDDETGGYLELAGASKARRLVGLATLADSLGLQDEAIRFLDLAYAAFDEGASLITT